MAQSPFKKLDTEVSRLRGLYFTSVYSYAQTAKDVHRQIHTSELDPQQPLLMDPSNPDSLVANHAYAFLHRIKSQFPRYLRETIFVRLISAIEVYLIDIVRELFLHRRDLFHSDQLFEFSHREILAARTVTVLWSKIVNRELRRLQNQGFKEVVRFFDQRFGIDLGRSPASIKQLQEMHDRRHLLVHRLGRADSQYRHTYTVTRKVLTVDEPYLLDAFKNTFQFAEFVWNEVQALVESAPPTDGVRAEHVVELIVEVLTERGAALINPAYHFQIEDEIARLSDILTEQRSEGERVVLTIAGASALVKEYVKRLRKAGKKTDLILHGQKRIRWKSQSRCRLPRSKVESIARSLPPQPWPTGIHKQVASERGISNTQASAAISMILEDAELADLIGSTHVA